MARVLRRMIALLALAAVGASLLGGAGSADRPSSGHAEHEWRIFGPSGEGLVRALVAEGAEIDGGELAGQLGAEAVAGSVPFRWETPRVTWGYNATGGPAGAEGWLGAIEGAAWAWNTASGGAWAFAGGKVSDAAPGACDLDGDGQNTIGWERLPEGVLGYTCILFADGEGDTRVAAEFDIVFNSQPGEGKWSTEVFGGEFDLPTIAVHELGHAMGLGHAETCPGAVMCDTYTPGSVVRTPQADDVRQVAELYGEPVALSSTLALSLAAGTTRVEWSAETMEAAEVVAASGGALKVIYGWDEASGTWTRHLAGAPAYVNTLERLEQGFAYWFVAEGDLTLELY